MAVSDKTTSQWAILGALRFMLALIVVVGHFLYFIGPDTHHLFDASPDHARSAVWGFFVLSGFSIAASLEKGVRGFFRRRVIRIYPVYLAAIFAGLILYLLKVVPAEFTLPIRGEFHAPTFGLVVASIFMLQTIYGVVQIVWPSWSLSIEWWHYMAAPLLRRLHIAALVLLAATSWWFYLRFAVGDVSTAINSMQFGWRAIATSWFWLTGFIFYRMKRGRLRVAFLLVPTIVTVTLDGYIGVPMLVTLFVLLISEDVLLGGRLVAIFNWLGDLSYPMYLFHGMTLIVMTMTGYPGEIRTLSAVFVVSILVLYAVDYPGRTFLKRRLLAN
ncbi:acyltransferase family protein [Paraburkholderia tropica]|uniref:acyltransferase family protein n=1 Tax=Paraburkholderia tropica TaxID=92647 RepID=UPI002AAF760E|nr:acyltransferase [Paraburkholderia tropica]